MRVEALQQAIAEGHEALARAAWAEARARFAAALRIAEAPEALEGLGMAARYQLDADSAIDAHKRGFRVARSTGDDAAAARFAIQLAYDAYAFRGPAEASGWLERAALLVDGRPPSLAAACVPMLRAHLALLLGHDPERARAETERAIALAREVGAVDVEMFALALNGLSLVSLGEVAAGMRRIDAATAAAVGGEMSEVDSIESVCCCALDACKRVRDLERANEWCLRVRDIAARFGDRQMFSVCRVHYADVLLWHGDFDAAEAELEAAIDELGEIQPGRAVDPLVRLAELRRRQGRLDEAEQLLDRVHSHRLHSLVEGLLALDRGDVASAVEAADRFLRRVGETDRFERVAGLELQVRARLAAGDLPAAHAAADEIASIASLTSTTLLRAASLLAEGRLAAAQGEGSAAALLEDAADLFEEAGARYDAALARLELASTLRARGHDGRAARAAARARDALRELGARLPEEPVGALSPRETEVLRLLVRGLSNDDIAHELVLSVRTVERHVANIYAKIGASGRTARAIATAWANSHGIT